MPDQPPPPTPTLFLTRATCRDCGRATDRVLDLGTVAITAFPHPGEPLDYAPLELRQCDHCGLVQLGHTVDPDRLYKTEYWYRSGINEAMRDELGSIVQQAMEIAPIARGSLVLDVGANDGTLLQQYLLRDRHPFRIAVEPSQTFRWELRPHADEVIDRYFPNADLVDEYTGAIRILTSIACFYDLDDPHAFCEAVYRLLAPRGVWVVQLQDLAQMLEASAFDNLCHEHLCYYSLQTIEHLIRPHGLQVVHAERRAINGGSLRLLIQRSEDDPRIQPTVEACRQIEAGCGDWSALAGFARQTQIVAAQIAAAVATARANGWTVDLYGASTKANTLLQVCGLGGAEIRQAWERSSAKWGRQTVTGIPIVSEADGRLDPPELLLAGIWQFRAGILEREASYLAGGGRICFPLPRVDLVEGAPARAEAAR